MKNTGNRESDVTDDPITEWMTMVAWNTGRAAEVASTRTRSDPPGCYE